MIGKFVLFLLFMLPMQLWAQGVINGKVYDFENKKRPLQNVRVRNLTSDKLSYTQSSGTFKLSAKIGDLLEFSLSGYHTDTLYLINLLPKTIYLPVGTTDLNEVNILGAKINNRIYTPDPDIEEFKQVQTDGLRGKGNTDRAGGIKLNLGYRKHRENQEKLKRLDSTDKYETEINGKFTDAFVSELTALKGKELKDFMERYRPTVNLVSAENPFDYTNYIIKAYSRWKKMSPAERSVPAMPKLKRTIK